MPAPATQDTVRIRVDVRINGETFTVQHQGPLVLGARHRWSERLTETIARHTAFIAKRFEVVPEIVKATAAS